MSVIAFALVVRSTTGDDHAAAKTARALWLAVSTPQPVHVHDWDTLAPGIRGCKTCDTAMGLVTT